MPILQITPFAWSGLLAGVTSIALGLLVFLKSANRKLSCVWGLFSITVAVWGFSVLYIGMSADPEQSLMAWKIAFAFGVIWMAPIFNHFVCIFCEKNRRFLPLVDYCIAFFFFATVSTDAFFVSSRLVFGSFYYSVPGRLFPIFLIWWMWSILYSHYKMVLISKQATTVKKNQIKYFYLATALGYTGGSLCYLPQFKIDIYPWGNFTVFLYPIIMSYAILKYRLMEVSLFIKRTFLLALIYLSLLVISAPIFWSLHVHLFRQSDLPFFSIAIEVFFLSSILSLGPFLYAFFIKKSLFFQDHIIASVTHELKTPLAAIENAIELIAQLSKKGEAERTNEYVEMIQRNTSRLYKYVDNLIRVLRNPKDGVELTFKKANIKNLCMCVIEAHRENAYKKGTIIELNMSNEDLEVHCDQQKIEQTLSNLISNSVKFTNQGKIQIFVENKEGIVVFSIVDNGCGVLSHDLPYIFDRFYQGKNARTSKGTGIGLTIAKTWVEAHGGRIWAESQGSGKGTKITFNFPY